MDFNVSFYVYLEAMLKYIIPELALYNYNFFLIFSSYIFCLDVLPFVDNHRHSNISSFHASYLQNICTLIFKVHL